MKSKYKTIKVRNVNCDECKYDGTHALSCYECVHSKYKDLELAIELGNDNFVEKKKKKKKMKYTREQDVQAIVDSFFNGKPKRGPLVDRLVKKYCIIDFETHCRLQNDWKSYWPNCFTAIDDNNVQLPKNKQILWYLPCDKD